jgi:hypothetical protein
MTANLIKTAAQSKLGIGKILMVAVLQGGAWEPVGWSIGEKGSPQTGRYKRIRG